MEKEQLDIPLLEQLRGRFLASNDSLYQDYWNSRHALEQYHETFAQRIGWKWTQVLQDLATRWENPTFSTVLDFGCGTGIAALKFAKAFPTESVELWDRSALSTQFAAEHCEDAGFSAKALARPPESFAGKFVLLSHVATELRPTDREVLIQRLQTSEGFCWVEPGTPDASAQLIQVRKELLKEFEVLAPCPHQDACGLEKNDTGAWCHHFAKTPGEVFQSAFWKKFGDGLGIDLRSLPTSYLVMRRRTEHQKPVANLQNRVLGRARFFKGYAQYWNCESGRVQEVRVMEKKNKALIRRLDKEPFRIFIDEKELEGVSPVKKTQTLQP